jgi:hypothetical protein
MKCVDVDRIIEGDDNDRQREGEMRMINILKYKE